MKRITVVLLSIFLLTSLCANAFAEDAGPEDAALLSDGAVKPELSEKDQNPEYEWNILIYLCGTDLERKGSCATNNLKAIAATTPDDRVNLLIETGGSKQWNSEEELGFEIANDKLQRWHFGEEGFTLVDEVDEACMSDDRTLSEFIRWGTENYSAKKNMLLLWDHGGGSNSGLIYDENYGDKNLMPLYSLEKALKDGGAHFDLVLTDTCLLASLEMCQTLAPYADYLAASEEIMAGDGTNYKGWVQYLYDRPECNAIQLGKRICDSTQQYYTEKKDPSEASVFTMSLIDLSMIDPVAEAFNTFMHNTADLVRDADAFYEYAKATYYAENYYLHTMFDLFDLSRRAENGGITKEVTHALQDAVEDAVIYNLRSDNHMYSHGLSVYYPLNDDAYELDHFARSCKNPEHLAFLDSISVNWEAPEWVYEETERHPELDRSAYFVESEIFIPEDGSGAYLTVPSGYESVMNLSYALYYKDPESKVMYALGESGNLIPELDEEKDTYRFALGFDGTWPSMSGKPLCMLITEETESYILYNVPIESDGYTTWLRVMVDYEGSDEEQDSDADSQDSVADSAEAGTESVTESEVEKEETEEASETVDNEKEDNPFELLGIWDGYDSHTGLPGRNIVPMSEVDGTEVALYDVVYSCKLDEIAEFIDSKTITLTKDTKIDREKLPSGEYMVRFETRDVFNNIHYSDYFIVNWDGENVVCSEEE